MITVEEAINIRHYSSGFMLQNRALLGREDKIMFTGADSVARFATIMGSTPIYTWAPHVKRMVDQSCADYPLQEAIGAIHYFHQPSMLWMCDEALMWIQPPVGYSGKFDGPQPVDGVLITPWTRGDSPPLREFLKDYWEQTVGNKDERDKYKQSVLERATGFQITALSSWKTGIEVPLPRGTLPAGSRVMVPVMIAYFEFGKAAVLSEDDITDSQRTDPTLRAEQTKLRQWVLAATALLKQRILVAESQIATRGERKRLERQDLPNSVMTITLRETDHQSTYTHQGIVDWSHRWIVRGHWRQQWYASQEEHRIIWIPAHIKGPDDKPLVVRPAVYAVTR